jgi:hypothetical protein
VTDAIIVAIITGAFSFLGVYFSNRKSAALVEYRLKQLEEKVAAHNNLVERMYAVEEKQALTDEKLKVANHRIDDLERSAS